MKGTFLGAVFTALLTVSLVTFFNTSFNATVVKAVDQSRLVANPSILAVDTTYSRKLFIGQIKPKYDGRDNYIANVPFDDPTRAIWITSKQYKAPSDLPPAAPHDGMLKATSTDSGAIAVIGQYAKDDRGEFIWSTTILGRMNMVDGLRLWMEWKDQNISQYFPPTIEVP